MIISNKAIVTVRLPSLSSWMCVRILIRAPNLLVAVVVVVVSINSMSICKIKIQNYARSSVKFNSLNSNFYLLVNFECDSVWSNSHSFSERDEIGIRLILGIFSSLFIAIRLCSCIQSIIEQMNSKKCTQMMA